MSDLDAFLAGIRKNPEDDAPRLILADWLEEHGDQGWAELIRLQIATPPVSEWPAHKNGHYSKCLACEYALSQERYVALADGMDWGIDRSKVLVTAIEAEVSVNNPTVTISRGMPYRFYGSYNDFVNLHVALSRWPITQVILYDVAIGMFLDLSGFGLTYPVMPILAPLDGKRWKSIEKARDAVSKWLVAWLHLPF